MTVFLYLFLRILTYHYLFEVSERQSLVLFDPRDRFCVLRIENVCKDCNDVSFSNGFVLRSRFHLSLTNIELIEFIDKVEFFYKVSNAIMICIHFSVRSNNIVASDFIKCVQVKFAHLPHQRPPCNIFPFTMHFYSE